ncbi:MAG TPA: fibronectin type III domain-containing protein [Treponemataceae bacterium]|nr:fibronectin type III domain-containing protein [Treponemataceae bacterium]
MINKIKLAGLVIVSLFLLTSCTLMYGIFGPPVPSDLQVDSVSSFKVNISWKMNDDFEYLVSYTSADGSDSVSSLRIGTVSSFVIDRLKPSTEYTITLQSQYKDKISDETDSVTAKTLLTYPKDISFSQSSKDSVFISWSPIADASGYIIYYDTNDSFSNNLSLDSKAETFYTLSGLQASTPYYFSLAAYNDEGQSDKSPVELYSTKVTDYALGFYDVAPSDASLSLTGLNNNRIYMVKMNPSSSLVQSSSTRSITNTASANIYSRTVVSDPLLQEAFDASESGSIVSGIWDSGFIRFDKPEPQKFSKLDPLPLSASSQTSASKPSVQSRAPSLNDKRNFWVQDAMENWIEKSAVLSSIGDYCYVWTVEENYSTASVSYTDNKITEVQSKEIAVKFDQMYPSETAIFGNKYSVKYPDFIDPKDKISILIYDIDADYSPSQNSGVFGFFWAKDYYLGGPDGSIPGYGLKTNEDELFYIDSHFLDSYPEGIYSTLAHEFQHMLNFVQKDLTYGLDPDIWYNEMLSMVCEDLLSAHIGITKENGPQSRLYEFIYSYYESGLSDWLSGQDVLKSYAGAYTFGAFLARNYGGAQFIKDLASSRSVDQTSINDALAKSSVYSTENFGSVFKSYGRSLCYADIPSSYNIPSLNMPSSSIIGAYTYNIYPINLEEYFYYAGPVKKYGLMKLSASSAGSVDLRPYGFSVHYWGKASGDVTLNFTASQSSLEKVYIIVE